MNRAQRREWERTNGRAIYTPGDMPTKHVPVEQVCALPKQPAARKLSHAETRAKLADRLAECGMPREEAEAAALDTSVRASRRQGLTL